MVLDGHDPLNENRKIGAALDDATGQLSAVSESPRLDAELLLARSLDVARSYLFAHPEEPMDPGAVARFREVLDKRVEGMPMAYITGEKEFWSMTLMVNPATLVPRPDTETLVDQALTRIPRRAAMRIVDLGTGSGAVALAIARERPLCQVVATDISTDALAVASLNARELAIPNVEFVAGHWMEAIAGRTFDLIVSNPPYVASDDPHLATLRHEPVSALAAGADGLDAIREIAATAMAVLEPGGELLLEHGANQADGVGDILREQGWTECRVVNDLSGQPRVSTARKPVRIEAR
jgi:release factor glutamine methyltransferase